MDPAIPQPAGAVPDPEPSAQAESGRRIVDAARSMPAPFHSEDTDALELDRLMPLKNDRIFLKSKQNIEMTTTGAHAVRGDAAAAQATPAPGRAHHPRPMPAGFKPKWGLARRVTSVDTTPPDLVPVGGGRSISPALGQGECGLRPGRRAGPRGGSVSPHRVSSGPRPLPQCASPAGAFRAASPCPPAAAAHSQGSP